VDVAFGSSLALEAAKLLTGATIKVDNCVINDVGGVKKMIIQGFSLLANGDGAGPQPATPMVRAHPACMGRRPAPLRCPALPRTPTPTPTPAPSPTPGQVS